jgi:hypothetical protein
MFNVNEVSILLSGSSIDIDVDDWKRHTVYDSCSSSHSSIAYFWEVVSKELSNEDRAALLRFTTSCSRPPTLGFHQLQPPFTIRLVDVEDTHARSSSFFSSLFQSSSSSTSSLPTAATCFNVLKLPKYTSKKVLKNKILQAIHQTQGFHLI